MATLSVVAIFAIGWFALIATVTQQLQAIVYLLLLLPISFLTTTAHARVERLGAIDYALAAMSFAAALWFTLNEPRYANWVTGFSSLSTGDLVAGTTLFVLCLELCRRAVGFGLTVVLLVLLAYVAFGQLIPGSFRHAGIGFRYFLEMQTIGTDGIFGDPVYVAAKYAFLFVLFGNLFVISGGCAAVLRSRRGRDRPQHRRSRQGLHRIERALRHGVGKPGRRRRHHRSGHHPDHEAHRHLGREAPARSRRRPRSAARCCRR